MKPIRTIGHSNHPIERFVALLKAAGIARLVDVRSMPWSRRFPQFGRERLARSLAEAGIAYAWEGEALGGKPGGLSARYAGEPKSDERNNARLIEKLQGKDNRRAWYYCVLVLVRHADDPQPLVADGMWLGEVQDQAAGEGGFGYDPYFFLPDYGCTVAQLDAAEKNRVSHRGKAMQGLLLKLQELA